VNGEGVLLRFNMDSKGNISSRYEGVTVYPHNNWSNLIQSGDSWFCTFDTYSSEKAYFAIPHRKLDETDFRDMIDNNMNQIAAIIWEDYRDDVMMAMDEYISEEVRLELESKKNEVNILKDELDKRDTIADVNVGNDNTSSFKVSRIGPISLKSDFFDSRVSIKLSPDLKRMVVTNDPDGQYSVNNGILTIRGFDAILDFKEECEMLSIANGNSISITMYDRISGHSPSIDVY